MTGTYDPILMKKNVFGSGSETQAKIITYSMSNKNWPHKWTKYNGHSKVYSGSQEALIPSISPLITPISNV